MKPPHLFCLLLWIFDVQSKVYKIGLLLPREGYLQTFGWLTNIGAVSLALEALEKDRILPDDSLKVVWRDTQGNPVRGSGMAEELRYQEDIDVIIGAPLSRVSDWMSGLSYWNVVIWDKVQFVYGKSTDFQFNIPVGYLTSYWNIPHITWASIDSVMADKVTFATLIRVMEPLNTVESFLASVLLYFNWTVVGLYSSSSGIWYSFAGKNRSSMKESNISVEENIVFDENTVTKEKIINHLRKLQRSSRIKSRIPTPDRHHLARRIKLGDYHFEYNVIILSCEKTWLRMIMIQAARLGMCKGDYVFLTVFAAFEKSADEREPLWYNNATDDFLAKAAFQVLFRVVIKALVPRPVSGFQLSRDDASAPFCRFHRLLALELSVERSRPMKIDEFRELVIDRLKHPPWNIIEKSRFKLTGSTFSIYLYDSVYLYGVLMNKSMAENIPHRNGRQIANLTRRISFKSNLSGIVQFGDNADRNPMYLLFDYSEPTGLPRALLRGSLGAMPGDTIYLNLLAVPKWRTLDGKVPVAVPKCGFVHEFCTEEVNFTLPLIFGLIGGILGLAFAVTVITIVIKKHIFDEQVAKMVWKIDFKEVISIPMKLKSQLSYRSVPDNQSLSPMNTAPSTLANYRGNQVVVKKLERVHVTLNHLDYMEIKLMRSMSHENVNPFVGVCIDLQNLHVLYMHCSKGCLRDILENDEIKLDSMFRKSFLIDLINGMHYIHSSSLGSHGNLKSSNCVVDGRWVLKVTDYGPTFFQQLNEREDAQEQENKYQGLLWTAPEKLRLLMTSERSSKAADVYSFSIILHEIYYRMGTFPAEGMCNKDIIGRVKNGESIPFRPFIPKKSNVEASMEKLMQSCWVEDAAQRPDFGAIKLYVRSHNKDVDESIMDTILKKMERYTDNLEVIVKERTLSLVEEKKRSDNLLYQLIPPCVAEQLKEGKSVPPEFFDSVTIFFSDIVSFTALSAISTPLQVVTLLNDLYTLFDAIINKHDVYKVEIIGDAYMVVSGLPCKNDNHAKEIADMALSIVSAIVSFRVAHMPSKQLQVRIGLHTGPCCAGIVGIRMPRYCLFGDTVNTASRMESTGNGGRIHISHSTKEALEEFKVYNIELKGQTEIKGKGTLTTYWLNGKTEIKVHSDFEKIEKCLPGFIE